MEDLVKVIRCENCDNFQKVTECDGYCYYWDYEQGMSPNRVYNDDYCSNAELKKL